MVVKETLTGETRAQVSARLLALIRYATLALATVHPVLIKSIGDQLVINPAPRLAQAGSVPKHMVTACLDVKAMLTLETLVAQNALQPAQTKFVTKELVIAKLAQMKNIGETLVKKVVQPLALGVFAPKITVIAAMDVRETLIGAAVVKQNALQLAVIKYATCLMDIAVLALTANIMVTVVKRVVLQLALAAFAIKPMDIALLGAKAICTMAAHAIQSAPLLALLAATKSMARALHKTKYKMNRLSSYKNL